MKFGKISKRLRITIVLSVIWLIFILLAAVNDAGAGGYRFDFATFISIFFGLGVLPIIVLWGIIWIYGTSKERQKKNRE